MSDDRDDPDRAAILARRSRLIAIAMSGFTLTGACGESEDPAPPEVEQTQLIEPAPPQPCLEPPSSDPPETDPLPCLAVAVPREPPPDIAEERRPAPQTCLSVRPRREPEEPVAPPQPCLSVAPVDPPEPPRIEAAPQACLTLPQLSRKSDV